MKKGLELPQVTLICVSGVRLFWSAFALWRSAQQITFGEKKLITPHRFSLGKTFEVEHPSRSRLSNIDEYSHFMIYDLWEHVQTEFALVVQWDGYVLNTLVWRSEFLKYDYIGAPWPLVDGLFVRPSGEISRVGNGGFSLRSKKLLEVPNSALVTWDTSQNSRFKHTGRLSEDGNICVHNRSVYESAGCEFAPLALALRFSIEEPVPEHTGDPTFGFHKRLPRRYWMREVALLAAFSILFLISRLFLLFDFRPGDRHE